jgi:ABC-type dipeptide/oligopeptide/nickel transport system ATPase component
LAFLAAEVVDVPAVLGVVGESGVGQQMMSLRSTFVVPGAFHSNGMSFDKAAIFARSSWLRPAGVV